MPGAEPVNELFGTETMAELCARQGRVADALAIYRRLIASGGDEERRARWAARAHVLESGTTADRGAARLEPRGDVEARVPASRDACAPTAAAHRLPMVVRQPVRAGQIVYAESSDLIVLAPVNPGAQLMADGNIHVYAALRGRAVAGVRGAQDARIFCQRLDAELVGIDAAYVTADDLPPERVGKAAQVFFEAGACVVAPL